MSKGVLWTPSMRHDGKKGYHSQTNPRISFVSEKPKIRKTK